MTVLEARFTKQFPGGIAIQAELSCEMERFSLTVLYGPSGCGKTTILRCLAGLERPEQGTIRVDTETWLESDRAVCLSPQQRDVGYLFQEYALFPHLNVEQNIAFGLTRLSYAERRRYVSEFLDRFELQGLNRRFPNQISGGQRQRVALARVLARRPRLLLLDEPLAALDLQVRDQVRHELRSLLSEFSIPVVMVTHDRIEALTLADRLIVLRQGRILQSEAPDILYHQPRSPEVARMLGIENILPAVLVDRSAEHRKLLLGAEVIQSSGTIVGEVDSGSCTAGAEVTIVIHAVDVQLRRDSGFPPIVWNGHNRFSGRLKGTIYEGPLVRVMLDCGFPLISLVTRPDWEQLKVPVGQAIQIVIATSAIHVIANPA